MNLHSNTGVCSFSKGRVQVTKIPEQKRITRYKKSDAIKELEKLSLDAKRLRYPLNPFLVGDTFRDDTANGLTKAIIAFLRLRGHQIERINVTGRPKDHTKTFTDVLGNTRMIGSIDWIKTSGTVGSADLSGIINSISVKIEVKIGRDVQSEAQFRYQQEVEASGGYYVIAKTFDGFVAWYNQCFKR